MWLWNPFNLIESFKENSDWKILKGESKKEECIDLLLGQKLIYSFISSSEILFKIDLIEEEKFKNFLSPEKTDFKKGVFLPKKNGTFCLIWTNISLDTINLNYNFQKIIDKDKNKIAVNYKISPDNKSIHIESGSGDILSKILLHSPIVNFAINKNSSILVVSVYDSKSNLRVYNLKNLQMIETFNLESVSRFIVFSRDDRFVVLGDEHSNSLKRIDLKNGTQEPIILPLSPIALFVGDKPNELLVRSEKEIIKIQIDPIELLERNARIEFVFGDETILLDPDELCNVHGVPHPLFTPREIAMSEDGLSGYYFKSK